MSIFIVDNVFRLFRTRSGTVAEFDPKDYHLAVNYCESRFGSSRNFAFQTCKLCPLTMAVFGQAISAALGCL